ncbi:hypothetical protein JD844_023698 [Phrynosoma platyrhinos]|uniref:UBX domain-containing protein n=1 Tax=Phrynosoma platyrhinos TaxID=52577 RepID=A0ABQ7SXD6_PHRPL|nr:hypothetical protein JD844_023698 [Phrynosoma platyrhinos]
MVNTRKSSQSQRLAGKAAAGAAGATPGGGGHFISSRTRLSRTSAKAAAAAAAAAAGQEEEAAREVLQLLAYHIIKALLYNKRPRVCTPRNDSQIQNGTDQKSCDIFVDNLFEEAQKVGAVCTQQAKVKNQNCTTDLVPIVGKPVVINGFFTKVSVKNTYFALQKILCSISHVSRELPPELQKICDKEELDVKVDDKKDEVYTARKPVFHPFSGQGYRLGSATPRVIYKIKRDVEETEKKKPTVVLNYSEPITSVQIWLADGTRIVQKFNISHRISHVRDFIMTYQGHQGRSPFILTTSLPFRELLNESLTLEEANLKNAVIVQRLKNMAEPFRGLS